jgi:PilZ domain
MSQPFEREHFRIQYPAAARPEIVIDGRAYDVLDISEHGVRFRGDGEISIAVGDPLSGSVRFRRTEAVDVRGTVLRIAGREVAAKLDAGVPLKVMIEEQRYIREQHGGASR